MASGFSEFGHFYKKPQFLIAQVIGALVLMIPAFYNGYPLVNSDEASYLESGFQLYMPGDRPFMYGLFLNVASLNGFSLWVAVAVQALVMSYLLLQVWTVIIRENALWSGLIVIAILSFTSTLAWITSELTPDVWTTACLLSFFLIIIGRNSIPVTILLYFIYGCGVATHMSHFLIFTVLIGIVFLLAKYVYPITMKKGLNRSLLLLLAINFLVIALNSRTISSSKHVFFIASMLDKGILQQYLNEFCPDKNFKLCKYKDQLTSDPNVFLWDEQSPLYLEGGWEKTKAEYNQIIDGSLSDPKYIGMHLRGSLNGTARQLTVFDIGDTFPFPEGSHVYKRIEKYLPNDVRYYKEARQHQENIVDKMTIPNGIIYVIVVIAVIILLFMFVVRRKYTSPFLLLFTLLAGFTIIINAWDCGTFAQVNGRFGARVIWLIPFCALLFLFQSFAGWRSVKH